MKKDMKLTALMALLGYASTSEEFFFHPSPTDLLEVSADSGKVDIKIDIPEQRLDDKEEEDDDSSDSEESEDKDKKDDDDDDKKDKKDDDDDDDDDKKNLALSLAQLPSGICQTKFGYQVYDITPFDSAHREKSKSLPAYVDMTDSSDGFNSTFMYKACSSWTMKDKVLTSSNQAKAVSVYDSKLNQTNVTIDDGCDTKSSAYYMEDGKCVYTFKRPDFTGIKNTSSELNTTKGFKVTYTSNEPCTKDATKKFTFTINQICNPGKEKEDSDFGSGDCEAEMTYKGKNGCSTIDLSKFMKFFDKFAKFGGIILIGSGLVMTFAGAKFLLLVFTCLVGFAVTGIFSLVVYNLFLSPDTEQGVFLTIFVIAALLGIAAGYFSKKFAKAWATTLLAVWVGFIAASMLAKLLGIYNQYASTTIAILGAVGAGVLGKKLDKHIKSFGTAFIGAYLLIRGIGTYAGGYPSEAEIAKQAEEGNVEEYNPYVWLYFLGFVAFAVGGSFVQLKYLRAEEEDKKEDAFEAEDEAKVCGCF